MRTILIFTLLAISTNAFTQIKVLQDSTSEDSLGRIMPYSLKDTIPNIIHKLGSNAVTDMLYVVDGFELVQQDIGILKTEIIAKLNVETETITTLNKKYEGVIYITTKKDYHLKLISLKEFSKKYLPELDLPVIFLLDGRTIHEEDDSYFVDQKHIMKIEVENYRKPNHDLQLYIVNLITRTKANLEKANMIRIRGDEN